MDIKLNIYSVDNSTRTEITCFNKVFIVVKEIYELIILLPALSMKKRNAWTINQIINQANFQEVYWKICYENCVGNFH